MSNSLFPLRLSITLIFQVQGTKGGCAMELLDVTQGELPFAVDVWWGCDCYVLDHLWKPNQVNTGKSGIYRFRWVKTLVKSGKDRNTSFSVVLLWTQSWNQPQEAFSRPSGFEATVDARGMMWNQRTDTWDLGFKVRTRFYCLFKLLTPLLIS